MKRRVPQARLRYSTCSGVGFILILCAVFITFSLSLGPCGSCAGRTTVLVHREGYQEAPGIPRLPRLDGLLLKDFLQTDQKSVSLASIQTDHVISHVGRLLLISQ